MAHQPVAVKVVAFWGGRRRCQYRRRGKRVPFLYHVPGWGAEYACRMLDMLVRLEVNVDKGIPCDTIIVNSDWWDGYQAFSDGRILNEDIPWILKQQAMLYKADGAKTPNGRIRVLHRENIGISFGAFNDAYTRHRGRYDWWFFTEDDYLFERPGYVRLAHDAMQDNPGVGFLALKKGPRVRRLRYAPGGIGMGRKAALEDAFRANTNPRHPDGHLPYYYATGYDKQIELGEIRFTRSIVRAGWDLEYWPEHIWTHWTEMEKP